MLWNHLEDAARTYNPFCGCENDFFGFFFYLFFACFLPSSTICLHEKAEINHELLLSPFSGFDTQKCVQVTFAILQLCLSVIAFEEQSKYLGN